ncbi:hypothetical protein F2P81_009870 [Scophthalmus maximus]|uniref:Uncharacterized protein n=1 Tax=Scophthalmus maximus TaxID=52904 RepID=A0A6A4SPF5_SCOMX|nr:hypothetical protein F2P81_009870 [Scophthalmus maximus]
MQFAMMVLFSETQKEERETSGESQTTERLTIGNNVTGEGGSGGEEQAVGSGRCERRSINKNHDSLHCFHCFVFTGKNARLRKRSRSSDVRVVIKLNFTGFVDKKI